MDVTAAVVRLRSAPLIASCNPGRYPKFGKSLFRGIRPVPIARSQERSFPGTSSSASVFPLSDTVTMAFAQSLGSSPLLAKGVAPKRAPKVACQAASRPRDTAEKALGVFVGGLVGVTLGLSVPAFTYTPSAEAGVVITQQEKKRVFNSDTKEETKEEKKATKTAAPSSGPAFGAGFPDAGTLALPLSIAGIAGATVAARTLDDGFDTFLGATLSRDCSEYVGYEVALKSDQGVGKTTAKGRGRK
ncbi:hypothetical protein BSKO_11559 [Bryopsis sp. KO-2023]|nr:hypothetical protein BSKO_11559 [Bryopsis sp. KO-2023]